MASMIDARTVAMTHDGGGPALFYFSLLGQLKWREMTAAEEEKMIERQLRINCPEADQLSPEQLEAVKAQFTPTIAVTYKELKYSRKFTDPLTLPQLIALLCHEADHLARMTAPRCGARDASIWNLVHDVIINDGLVGQKSSSFLRKGFEWLGEEGWTMAKLKADGTVADTTPDDITAEELYDLIPKDDENRSKSHGDALSEDAVGDIGDDEATVEMEITIKLEKASRMAESMQPGSTPGHLKEFLVKVKESRVAWSDKLRLAIIQTLGMQDWSYRNPERRVLHQDMILPGMIGLQTPSIAVCLDTSYSVVSHEALLSQLVAELEAVFRQVRPEKAWVLYCDTAVSMQEFNDVDTFAIDQLELRGGGGTRFDPPFEYMRDNNIRPTIVIYLTDGYGNVDISSDPGVRTIWCITGDNESFSPPFGEVIQVEIEK